MANSLMLLAANIAVLGVILFRGLRNPMLGQYPVFYGYTTVALAAAVVQLVAAPLYGVSSPQYYYAFHYSSFLIPVFQLWVLWDLYRRIIGNDKTALRSFARPFTVLIMVAAPVAWEVGALRGFDFFTRYHAVMLFLQVGACFGVYRAACGRGHINLGRNLRGILAGLSIMVALQAVNFSRFLFRGEAVQIFSFFVPFVYLLALIVFAYMLWNYQPIYAWQPAGGRQRAVTQERLQKVNEQLQQALRSLLLPR